MAMELTWSNIFQFFSAISPMLLSFLMILISLFNQDLKGVVYLAGILITLVINIFVLNIFKSEVSVDRSQYCSFVEMPFGIEKYNVPSLNSVLIAFTFAYLLMPMISNKQMNYAIISFIASLAIIDGVNKVTNKCTSFAGVILGILLGSACGFGWYTLFHIAGYKSLLYYNETSSNNTYCSRPKKQAFKCSVYKNGTLIKTL